MGQSGLPTTLIICCPLPAVRPQGSVEACLDAGGRVGVPVTWIVAADRLSLLAERRISTNACSPLALEIPPNQSRQELRQMLAWASAQFPGLDAAAIHGPLPSGHRQVLVASGIRVLYRDRIEDIARGSRRPAPTGWPCRSAVWGLWEVARAVATPPGLISRLVPWGARPGPSPGSLAVIDINGQEQMNDAASIRGRLERWKSWAERRESRGRVEFATLSDLPALIAGGGRLPVGGSVLRAA